MLALERIPVGSKKVGKLCCPECRSTHLRWRKRAKWWYCRHCTHTFYGPPKIQAILSTPMRRAPSIEHAGPAYYRGLKWSEFHEAV